MDTARVNRALALPETPELLLVRSLAGQAGQFTPTGNYFNDLVLAALSDSPTYDLSQYNNEFNINNINNELHWIHHKITGIPYHTIDLTVNDGYDLTHSIFYGTDFTRQNVVNADALTRVNNALANETDIELIGEYCMCLQALGGTIPPLKLLALQTWFDPIWDGNTNYHAIYVCALVFARI